VEYTLDPALMSVARWPNAFFNLQCFFSRVKTRQVRFPCVDLVTKHEATDGRPAGQNLQMFVALANRLPGYRAALPGAIARRRFSPRPYAGPRDAINWKISSLVRSPGASHQYAPMPRAKPSGPTAKPHNAGPLAKDPRFRSWFGKGAKLFPWSLRSQVKPAVDSVGSSSHVASYL